MIRILTVFGMAIYLSSCFGGDVNPRSKAKAGDWAEYVYAYSIPTVHFGQPKDWKEDRRLIMTVTAITKSEITIECQMKVKWTYTNEQGKEVVEEPPDTPLNISRRTDIPLDLPKEHLTPDYEDDALKKTGDGVEEIEIDGKKRKAHWISFEISDNSLKESWKLWYDPDGGAFPELKTVCDHGKTIGVTTVTLVRRGNKGLDKK